MGKGDARRPAAIPAEEFGDRWERVFKKVPAPPREGLEPHNAESDDDDVGPEYALLLGDGWSEIKPRSDHLPGGAFSKEKTDE